MYKEGAHIRDYEKDIFKHEIDSFIPKKIFDTHIHLYKKAQFRGNYSSILKQFPEEIMDIDKYKEYMKEIVPEREIYGLILAWPKENEGMDVDEKMANEFVSEQVRNNSNWKGSMVIRPDMDPEFIREEVKRLKLSGLKCYRGYSKFRPSCSADIPSYLPEEHVKIAHQESLTITLHIVKSNSLADKGNQETIVRYCQKYPNMRLILAHAARGMNVYHLLEGIESIKGLDNIWFDTSCVEESGAFEIIIRNFGHKKLLYGSDFPLDHYRGRLIGIGDSILLVKEDVIKMQMDSDPFAVLAVEQIRPIMQGIESLRAIKLAVINLKLSDNQIEDIFYNNAKGLFDF